MRSPMVAMLWENWRLTRVEAAQRFGVGMVAGAAAMTLFGGSATAAFAILAVIHCIFWLSISKLNGGRFMDGYKPGFPLYLLYTRPVSTAAIVGVAMTYDAVSCVALYIISAALLGLAYGESLPVFSVALLLGAFHFAYTCIQWSTRNRIVQWIGTIVISLSAFFLLKDRTTWPLKVEFSLVENAAMALVGVVSFALTVVGVARQRRGDSQDRAPRKEASGAYPDWIDPFFRFQCPTSSATRAQLWFELKSSGFPVLTTGLAASVLIFLLFSSGILFAPARQFAIGVPLLSAAFLLTTLGSNAFGIRKRQGRAYLSAFEATQPYTTAQMAELKILVRSVCILVALIAVGLSTWASSSLMSAWGEWMVEGNDVSGKMLQLRSTIGDAFGGLTARAFVEYAIVTAVSIAVLVASFAAFTAMRARYARRMLVVVWMLLLVGLALVSLAWAVKQGVATAFVLSVLLTATKWLAAAAGVISTSYLLWSGFAERALTVRYVYVAVLVAAAFAAIAGIPAAGVVGAVWLALLVLMILVVAPWAFSRVRQM